MLPTTAVAVIALLGVLYLFMHKRNRGGVVQKQPETSEMQSVGRSSLLDTSRGGGGTVSSTRGTHVAHTVSTRRGSADVPDSVQIFLGTLSTVHRSTYVVCFK